MTRAVITQPTFLPWLGWFDLMDQSDYFIVLDDVGFSKQSWLQRNRIRTPRGLEYLTVPTRTTGRLGQHINQTIIETQPARLSRKITRSVRQNYVKAQFFDQYFESFYDAFLTAAASGNLIDLNCGLISWIIEALGLEQQLIFSSNIPAIGQRGHYVANLCKAVGVNRYLSPAGAKDYLIKDYDAFETHNISIEMHVYEHPVYRQCFDPFMPYASVLDLLMNEGSDAMDILRSGRCQNETLF